MTAIYLRPVETISAGNWLTNSAGSDLHTALDESTRDDDDFVRSGDNPSADVFEVRLEIDGAGTVAPQSGGVTTVFGDESDGYVYSGGAFSWSGVDDGADNQVVLGQDLDVARVAIGTDRWAVQSFMRFDTSAVSGDVVGCTVTIYLISPTNLGDWRDGNHGTQTIALYDHVYSGNPSAGGWVPSSAFSGKATGSSRQFDRTNQVGYYTWGSTQGLIDAIGNASGGVTTFLLADVNQGVEPTQGVDETDTIFSGARRAGTANDPIISIDQRSNPVNIRFPAGRGGAQATIATMNLVAQFKQGATVIAERTFNGIAAALSLLEFGLTEAEADEIDWNTQDNFRLRISATRAS